MLKYSVIRACMPDDNLLYMLLLSKVLLLVCAGSGRVGDGGGSRIGDECAGISRIDAATPEASAIVHTKIQNKVPFLLYNLPPQSADFLAAMSLQGLVASTEPVSYRVPPTRSGQDPEESLHTTADVVKAFLEKEDGKGELQGVEAPLGEDSDSPCRSVFQTAAVGIAALFQLPEVLKAAMMEQKDSSIVDTAEELKQYRLITSIGSRGAGLHFHQHAHAAFLLTVGRKQWMLYYDDVGT